MTSNADLLTVAQKAVDRARDYLQTHRPSAIIAKGDRDVASDVDYAIERDLRDALSRSTPTIGFLGEEEGTSGNMTGLVWVLDPVDGTVNFTHGHPLVSVSLALLDDSRPVLGIVDIPAMGLRYWAANGEGAFRNGTPIKASSTQHLRDALIAIGDYAVGDGAADRNATRLALTGRLAAHVQRIRMHGSAAVDLAWLASGVIDGVVILANNPWDVAAGVAIAREAGALVLGADGSMHDMAATETIGVAPALEASLLSLLPDQLS
jgi:myo-inositol-1(or 4)-monophosphatase